MYDLDNDGYPDIFLVAGSVYPEVAKKLPKYPDHCPRLVFRNLGDNMFEELMDADLASAKLIPAAAVPLAISTTTATWMCW